jgi:hypothetical protein
MEGQSDGQPDKPTPFPSIDDDDDFPEPASEPGPDSSAKGKAIDKEKDKDSQLKKKAPAHRRTISGNILKLLRSGSSERAEQDGSATETSRSAMATAVADNQKRRRKGSLRKTVLGKGREKDRDRDRKGRSPLATPGTSHPNIDADTGVGPDTPNTTLSTPRPSVELSASDVDPSLPSPTPANPPRWPFRTLSRVSIPSIRSSIASIEPASSAASIIHPSSTQLSTSDDEHDHDADSPVAMTNAQRKSQPLRKIPTSSSLAPADSVSLASFPSTSAGGGGVWGSYFPSVSVSAAPSIISDTLGLRRSSATSYTPASAAAGATGYFATSHTHARSPLASAPQSVAGTPPSDLDDSDSVHDYAETAFWGYVILIVSWVVFVVGMGSCFGVWTWAWDVGETPYAPPELEDDPSLPITGYYPALMVLTAVMAWVWVVVAWVGMKYFRHADFRGEDG